ncbi:MAG: M15 family metallopeptidase [Clostridia bacterium]|nr:M15 family metallopeptidase [Clostridia bacterium]
MHDPSDVIDIHDPSGFVRLSDHIPDAIQEMRYATAFNFVGTVIDGYALPVALMTRQAAEALRDAAAAFRRRGLLIKVFDAYRPQRATDHFLRWLRDPEDTRMKAWFYPELDKSTLIDNDYIGPRSGHSRGSTVDLTLVDMATGRELDMGGPFDYFGDRSHADYAGDLTPAQRDARAYLRDAMVSRGFLPLGSEWWHFRLADEPYPHTCFDFPIDIDTLQRLAPRPSRPQDPKIRD